MITTRPTRQLHTHIQIYAHTNFHILGISMITSTFKELRESGTVNKSFKFRACFVQMLIYRKLSFNKSTCSYYHLFHKNHIYLYFTRACTLGLCKIKNILIWFDVIYFDILIYYFGFRFYILLIRSPGIVILNSWSNKSIIKYVDTWPRN